MFRFLSLCSLFTFYCFSIHQINTQVFRFQKPAKKKVAMQPDGAIEDGDSSGEELDALLRKSKAALLGTNKVKNSDEQPENEEQAEGIEVGVEEELNAVVKQLKGDGDVESLKKQQNGLDATVASTNSPSKEVSRFVFFALCLHFCN